MPSHWDEVIANFPRHPKRSDDVGDAIPDEEAVVATESFAVRDAEGAYRQIREGQRLHRDDWIVKREPRYFATAPVPLVPKA